MKIQVTIEHILAAKNSFLKTNPIEVAVNELNQFESVSTRKSNTHGFVLELDNRKVKLPPQAQVAMHAYEAGKEVAPFQFILPLKTSYAREDAMMREMMEMDWGGF